MSSRSLAALVVLLMVLPLGPVVLPTDTPAQETEAPEATPEQGQEAESPEESAQQARKEQKRRERQERIDSYLKELAEKKAAKEQRRVEQKPLEEQGRATEQAEAAAPDTAITLPSADKAARTWEPPKEKKKKRTEAAYRSLGKVQKRIRSSQLGADPTVREYLDLFDRQEVTPAQCATFANYLAQNGGLEDAVAYYDLAVRLQPENPLLWMNLGTLHRHIGDLSAAVSAYGRSIELDPNNGLARYNLGEALTAMNRYDDAIREFSIALRLDPALADPQANPQVVNNDLLLPVKLRLYQSQAGAMGLPLVQVPESESEER